jgi:hypothetical protein
MLATVLDAELPIYSISLSDPHNDEYTNATEIQLAQNGIVPWEGYKPFAHYCRDLVGTQACQAR